MQDGAHSGFIHLQGIGERREIWGEVDNGSDVQIAVGPAVKAVSNTGRKRVVHSRVTQGTLNSERSQAILPVKETRHADNRIELQQRQCIGRVVQIHLPGGQFPFQRLGQSIHVHFQSNGQSGAGAYTGADPAQIGSLNRLVQLEGVTPECLIPERVIPEDVPALVYFQ